MVEATQPIDLGYPRTDESSLDATTGELVIAYQWTSVNGLGCGPYLKWSVCVRATTSPQLEPLTIAACPDAFFSRMMEVNLVTGGSGASPDCDLIDAVSPCLVWDEDSESWINDSVTITVYDSDANEYPCNVSIEVGYDSQNERFYATVTDGTATATTYVTLDDLGGSAVFCPVGSDFGAIEFDLQFDPALCECPYPQGLLLTANLQSFGC